MNSKKFFLLPFVVILFSAFTFNSTVSWKIANGYSIKFAGTDAEGVFTDLKGDVKFDVDNPSNSSFSFTVAVSSINTGNGMKNRHAVGKNWFDAKNHPNITFKSNAVAKKGDKYEVTGIMTIHGVSKEMTIPFTFNGKEFTSRYAVNRMDFGVGSMKGMSKKVSNEIKIDVTIPVSK